MTMREMIRRWLDENGLSLSYVDVARAISSMLAEGKISGEQWVEAVDAAAAMWRDELAAELSAIPKAAGEQSDASDPGDADGDHASGLASAGFGTDEDYGAFGCDDVAGGEE
jgi:hypothetical protein